MGEIVTTAHIGARMHEVFEAEIRAGPRLDTRITITEEKKDVSDAPGPSAREGYEPWDETVSLEGGRRMEVVHTLDAIAIAAVDPVVHAPRTPRAPREPQTTPPGPAAASAHISINTRPWSRVFVGSRLLGTTPIGNVEVSSGSVHLRFVDRDGVEHNRTVSIPAGGEAREFFDLTTDPAP